MQFTDVWNNKEILIEIFVRRLHFTKYWRQPAVPLSVLLYEFRNPMWPCYHIHRFFRKLELWPLTLRPRTLTVKLIWIDTPIDTLENPRWLPSQVKAFTRFQPTWLWPLTLRPTCKVGHFTTGVYCVISASTYLVRLDSFLLGFSHFLLQLNTANVRQWGHFVWLQL